jgi:hypothetical protein
VFRLLRHEIEQTRAGDSVVITFTFHVEGPPGDRPFSLAITWPSGNTATLDSGEHLLPIEETGSTRLSVPMRLDNVPPNSACSVGLHIGGTPVGDVAFVIE